MKNQGVKREEKEGEEKMEKRENGEPVENSNSIYALILVLILIVIGYVGLKNTGEEHTVTYQNNPSHGSMHNDDNL